MRIAYVYDAVYPWVKGGAEKRVYEIGKRLAERGHEVHWFGLKWWNGANTIEKDGIIIHGIGKWDNLYVNGRRSIGEGIYFGLKTLTSLKGKFDVIDCQNFPYFSCLSSRIKASLIDSKFFITWYEIWGDYWYEYLGRKGLFGYLIEKLVSKIQHYAIAISEKIKEDLKALGFPESKILVIPNGVDYCSIKKIDQREEKFDVIYVGRLISHKRVDLLINAIAEIKKEIPDIKCGIIGDGPERDNLRKLSLEKELADNIKFFGFIEDEKDVFSIIKASKVFVLPSVREGFPNTILEANACGLPVITVRHKKNAGASVIWQGENGFVVDLDACAIANKILEIIQNTEILEKMRKSSLEFAKTHDWYRIVDLIEKAYKEVIECR
ncbi:MAG: glycosyltransferase family 4 protein [Elusimicrobiota bacterium]|nr:glycosyltransferase family 4 protein [Endomicrobiia bacterium]MDW8166251.1 glycosyltransferase family 4 protein [Elusimicrobiota bacterium]